MALNNDISLDHNDMTLLQFCLIIHDVADMDDITQRISDDAQLMNVCRHMASPLSKAFEQRFIEFCADHALNEERIYRRSRRIALSLRLNTTMQDPPFLQTRPHASLHARSRPNSADSKTPSKISDHFNPLLEKTAGNGDRSPKQQQEQRTRIYRKPFNTWRALSFLLSLTAVIMSVVLIYLTVADRSGTTGKVPGKNITPTQTASSSEGGQQTGTDLSHPENKKHPGPGLEEKTPQPMPPAPEKPPRGNASQPQKMVPDHQRPNTSPRIAAAANSRPDTIAPVTSAPPLSDPKTQTTYEPRTNSSSLSYYSSAYTPLPVRRRPRTTMKKRIQTFVAQYCKTYASKNLEEFLALFAPGATELGKPIAHQVPRYNDTFKKINTMDDSIDLESYAVHPQSGRIFMTGRFKTHYELKNGDRGESTGKIRMELSEQDYQLKVWNLTYAMDPQQAN